MVRVGYNYGKIPAYRKAIAVSTLSSFALIGAHKALPSLGRAEGFAFRIMARMIGGPLLRRKGKVGNPFLNCDQF
jgi:hypothetical protein